MTWSERIYYWLCLGTFVALTTQHDPLWVSVVASWCLSSILHLRERRL